MYGYSILNILKVFSNLHIHYLFKLTYDHVCLYRKYDTACLATTYLAVRNDRMSFRKAAKVYGVCYGTLRDRKRGNVGINVEKSGRASLFSKAQDIILASHMTNEHHGRLTFVKKL